MSLVLDILFPPVCSGCGRSGQYLCPKCQDQLIFKSINHSPDSRFEGRLSLFRYHGAIKNIISDLKFGFVTDLIPEFTGFISQGITGHYPHLLNYWQENHFILVPVPLYPRRLNWRGFNQSLLICQQLSSKLKLDYDPDILIRTKNTLPQTQIKNKLLRRQNTLSSFQLINSKFQNIILFDDVYTTGSTLKSAASVFPEHIRLWGLTLAG